MFKENEDFVPYCRDCITEKFEEITRRYKDERKSVMIMCHYLDIPFYHAAYETVILNNTSFNLGNYVRLLNGGQYPNTSFMHSLVDGELNKTDGVIQQERESKWSESDKKNKDQAIKFMGYDPFENHDDDDRRMMFNELVQYFKDDDISEDIFKLSQVVQIVINNNQIRRCDNIISSLNPTSNAKDIKELSEIKFKLVSNTDKISKENEISVRNRTNKDVGKSSLTFLMRDLREKNIKDIETNYYDQLRSPGTLWAMEQSMKAIKQNAFFDESDQGEIINMQRDMINNLQGKVDDLEEENRLMKIKIKELQIGVR